MHLEKIQTCLVNETALSVALLLNPGDDRKRGPMACRPHIEGGLVGARGHRRRRLLAQQVELASQRQAQNCKLCLMFVCGSLATPLNNIHINIIT